MIGQKGYPPVHGGIEKHVAELAARLPALGCDVEIYSRPHYSDAHGAADLPGVTVRRLPSIPTKHLDAISHTCLATVDVLARGCDVVHYHALGPGLLAGVPRWLAGRRTVVTVHGLDWQRDKWGAAARRVLLMGEKAATALPDRTIVVSRALREHYRERYGAETTYIPNGITPPTLRPPRRLAQLGVDRPYVLFVGRLVPEKGCHFLLDAWRSLPDEVRGAHQLVIAGDSGFTDQYVADLRAAAPPETVFVGYVHGAELEELFSNAAVMVLPSTIEGLSIALLEGMSYGRCCLVSDIPPNVEAAAGCAEAFPSGDVAALGRALAALLADPERRARMGEAAREHTLAHYAWDRVAEETAAVYLSLARGRGQF